MLREDEQAPLFRVPGVEGDVDLAALLGKGPVVLYFFPRAFTSG